MINRIIAAVIALVLSEECRAFNSMTHAQIMRTSWAYIQANSAKFPHSARWLQFPDFRKVMTRANIDADYLPDLWIGSALLGDSFAASTFGILNPFSTLFHHINASRPGKYWEFDGYSFEHSSRRGRDLFAAIPALEVDSSRSSPLGGHSDLHGMYVRNLGPYRLGFGGSLEEWTALYRENPGLSGVTFPPASVPAELAWRAVLKSPIALVPRTSRWTIQIPAIGLDGTSRPSRKYWRKEIPGLPQDLELLGFAIHLAQDMAVPQHARGTADLCHVELEALVDQLACVGSGFAAPELAEQRSFIEGTYDAEWPVPECQALASLPGTHALFRKLKFLHQVPPLSASEMTIAVARESAKWKFEKVWLGPYVMTLPSGKIVRGSACSEILDDSAVTAEIRNRYAMAVAVTVRLLETAAHAYESR